MTAHKMFFHGDTSIVAPVTFAPVDTHCMWKYLLGYSLYVEVSHHSCLLSEKGCTPKGKNFSEGVYNYTHSWENK